MWAVGCVCYIHQLGCFNIQWPKTPGYSSLWRRIMLYGNATKQSPALDGVSCLVFFLFNIFTPKLTGMRNMNKKHGQRQICQMNNGARQIDIFSIGARGVRIIMMPNSAVSERQLYRTRRQFFIFHPAKWRRLVEAVAMLISRLIPDLQLNAPCPLRSDSKWECQTTFDNLATHQRSFGHLG